MVADRKTTNHNKAEKVAPSTQNYTQQTISDLEETLIQKNKIIDILQETLNHYRLIADMSPHAIFVIDREGFVQYVNCYAATLLKNSAGNIVGKPVKALFPPDSYQLQRKSLKRVFEEKEPFRIEEKIVFPGAELWLDTHLIPLKDKDGNVPAILGISSNITEFRNKSAGVRFVKGLPEATDPPGKDRSALTKRELEILQLISSGLTNKEIASKLFLSVKTVDTHRTRIMKKVGSKNTAELVRYAVNVGIV